MEERNMMKRSLAAIACSFALIAPFAVADDLGMSGKKLVEPDCDAMSSWFNCRDIDTAPADVRRGYEYMHNTSRTLGPFGTVKYPDGSPYATAATACSSCHFTGGHVPFGTPVYQSPSKYTPNPITGLGPYFGPMGYYRDLEDSVIDCFRNCMNAERSPAKDDPVMRDLVAYIEWVADGITDPEMRENWRLLPPEAGPGLPVIPNVATMRADPEQGAELYDDDCSGCHDKDGPGRGEYRTDEGRPRTPALWGMRDGHSRAAAFYRNGVLGAYIRTHMPYGDANTLSAQDALDIAAYINAPDKPRPDGLADDFYCFDDPDGIPASLRKPADWLVGCTYPGEREHFEGLGYDYEDLVRNGPWAEITAWRQGQIAELQD
jgi:cytochrome c